jgi:sulfatase maturation enzyme AslB (radical SAM superfamily)
VRALELVLTTACNLSCAYCFQNVRQECTMDSEVLRPALDLLLRSDHPEPSLTFIGGEPLLAMPLITRAVEYIEANRRADQAFLFDTSTNGTLLDTESIQVLARHRIDTQISFDGVAEAQELRAPGTFARLDGVLVELRDGHPDFFRDHCSVSITLNSSNVPHLAESFAYLLDREVSEIAVSPLITHDAGWRPEMIEVLAEQIEIIRRLSIEHLQRTGEVPFAQFRLTTPSGGSADGPPAMCGAVSPDKLAVDVDGQVRRCVMMIESYQTIPNGMLRRCLEPMRLGDLRDAGFGRRLEDYHAAMRSARIFENKQDKYSSYRTCEGCRFLYQCDICPAGIGHIPGNTDPNRVPDLQCALSLVLLTCRQHFPMRPSTAETAAAADHGRGGGV